MDQDGGDFAQGVNKCWKSGSVLFSLIWYLQLYTLRKVVSVGLKLIEMYWKFSVLFSQFQSFSSNMLLDFAFDDGEQDMKIDRNSRDKVFPSLSLSLFFNLNVWTKWFCRNWFQFFLLQSIEKYCSVRSHNSRSRDGNTNKKKLACVLIFAHTIYKMWACIVGEMEFIFHYFVVAVCLFVLLTLVRTLWYSFACVRLVRFFLFCFHS